MTADPGNTTLVTERQRAGQGGWFAGRQQSDLLISNREAVIYHPVSHPGSYPGSQSGSQSGSHPVSHPASQIVCGSCSICTVMVKDDTVRFHPYPLFTCTSHS